MVVLPAKLLITFVLDFEKKSCFLSFVSWLQPLVPPTSWSHSVYFRLRLSNKPIDHFSLPQLQVSHTHLSEWKITFLPMWDFFFSWISLFCFFFRLISQTLLCKGRKKLSRCWGPGSPGKYTGATLIRDQKWCNQVTSNKTKERKTSGFSSWVWGLRYNKMPWRGSKRCLHENSFSICISSPTSRLDLHPVIDCSKLCFFSLVGKEVIVPT